MSHVDDLENWFVKRRDRLITLGEARFVRDPTGRTTDEFGGVYVESTEESVELLVWRSGSAEFDRGARASPTFEHVDLSDASDLARLLERAEKYLMIDDHTWSRRD